MLNIDKSLTEQSYTDKTVAATLADLAEHVSLLPTKTRLALAGC